MLRNLVALLICASAVAAAMPKLPVALGSYKLQAGDADCPAELVLTVVPDGRDHVLLASPRISFPHLAAGTGTDPEDASSCRYETRTTITATELTKRVRVTKCPAGEAAREITETLRTEPNGVSYTHRAGTTALTCRYRR